MQYFELPLNRHQLQRADVLKCYKYNVRSLSALQLVTVTIALRSWFERALSLRLTTSFRVLLPEGTSQF